MGKIMVVGKAEREYAPDYCSVKLEVEVVRKTASEASIVSSEQCEQLLAKLQELGIKPETVEIHSDRVDKRSDYHSNEISYESTKSLWLHLPADMHLINNIRAIIETGFEDVSFTTVYSVSNETELTKQLLKEAIADSRAKADFLATSMDLQITGIDSANLSGDEDVYDLCEDEKEEEHVYYCRAMGRPLSDNLKPNKIELKSEVRVVWLVG